MHLATLTLRNFRSFDEVEIPLRQDLSILIGENNSGKSNAIDAIRLLTKPLSGRRDLYCESTDIRFDSTARQFELECHFDDLDPAQQGRLISAAKDHEISGCVFGIRYDESAGQFPVRPVLWAGMQKGSPEPGCHDMIRHVYLPPLRDAKRALASGNPTRIYALLNHFLDGKDPTLLAQAMTRRSDHDILNRIGDAVGTGLGALTAGVRTQATSLGFANDEKLIDIARELRFNLADHGIQPEDLRYSGHGYANLLYMATIAVELEKVNDADLTLFLVEEPEAHLHPQLQAAVLAFLEGQAEKSRKPKQGYEGPGGQLQVIVATHSPNLSAWVESEKLVHFRSAVPPSNDSHVSTASETAGEPRKLPRRATRCVPLGSLDLTPIERRKVDRYLDVTRSALLFGGRVLLAEGIAEVLLLPAIAKNLLKERPDALRLFRSAVFVPIDGVDFAPYAKLLLTPHQGVRIADRVVIVTDGDSTSRHTGETSSGRQRKVSLDMIAQELGASTIMTTIVNTYSLETELVLAGNNKILRSVYQQLHPRSLDQWDAAVAAPGDSKADAIQRLFEKTRKGDFAQILAEMIREGADFTPPEYLAQAIETLVA